MSLDVAAAGGAVPDAASAGNADGPRVFVDGVEARARPHIEERNQPLFAVALVFAVLLHAGILAALGSYGEAQIGGRGSDLDAISVEVTLVPATAVESRAPLPDIAAGSTGPVEVVEGAVATPEPVMAEVRPREERISEETVAVAATPEPEPSLIPAPEDRDRKPTDDPVPMKPEQAAPPPPSAADGGVAARASDDKGPSTHGTAASRPGEVKRYARSVVETLTRRRPKGRSGAKGSAKVTFQISPDGSVAAVRIVMSSGNPNIDAAVIAAIAATQFPPPPPGMTPAQLTYEIPYHFR